MRLLRRSRQAIRPLGTSGTPSRQWRGMAEAAGGRRGGGRCSTELARGSAGRRVGRGILGGGLGLSWGRGDRPGEEGALTVMVKPHLVMEVAMVMVMVVMMKEFPPPGPVAVTVSGLVEDVVAALGGSSGRGGGGGGGGGRDGGGAGGGEKEEEGTWGK